MSRYYDVTPPTGLEGLLEFLFERVEQILHFEQFHFYSDFIHTVIVNICNMLVLW